MSPGTREASVQETRRGNVAHLPIIVAGLFSCFGFGLATIGYGNQMATVRPKHIQCGEFKVGMRWGNSTDRLMA
jgi:hypothetical protein